MISTLKCGTEVPGLLLKTCKRQGTFALCAHSIRFNSDVSQLNSPQIETEAVGNDAEDFLLLRRIVFKLEALHRAERRHFEEMSTSSSVLSESLTETLSDLLCMVVDQLTAVEISVSFHEFSNRSSTLPV